MSTKRSVFFGVLGGVGCLALMGCAVLPREASAPQPFRVAGVFSPHMVLQRGQEIPVWGWGSPGTQVTVALGSQSERTVVRRDGRWAVNLDAMPAGVGYDLRIATAETNIVLEDVLVGDVWLCGGQSNMEWELEKSRDGAAAVAAATNGLIRLLDVSNRKAGEPLPDLGQDPWKVCTPVSAKAFSAVGYYFGRDIHVSQGVPVGLIGCNWGGTPAEAWTSLAALRREPPLAGLVAKYETALREYPAALAAFKATEADRLAAYKAAYDAWMARVDSEDRGSSENWQNPALDVSAWRPFELPALWNRPVEGAWQTVTWLRKTFTVPDAWAGKEIRINLGGIDDVDVTWLNGEEIGRTGRETPQHWSVPRSYAVPGGKVVAGPATLVVRVRDFGTSAGFLGPTDKMYVSCTASGLTDRVSLAGTWLKKVGFSTAVADMPKKPVGPSDPVSSQGPGCLYNAMVHPLIPYAIKGVIWYQGEANAARAAEYRVLFPTLIRSWRSEWDQGDFPFIWVQLANYDAVPTNSADCSWAELREAQTETLRLRQTAQVVTIDVGDAKNIHPTDKQTVGQRLALAARRVAYGESLVYSGPLCRGAARDGDRVVLTFDHVGGGLVARDGALNGFEVAGPDGRFTAVEAVIVDATVQVKAAGVRDPLTVRYGWANNPVGCNLYNREGLPASPFRCPVGR